MRHFIHRRQFIFNARQAYVGPDGIARLFRPDLNMSRMMRSADRAALPVCESSKCNLRVADLGLSSVLPRFISSRMIGVI